MANTILTPSVITKETLRLLHQELNFIPNINTQYSDEYAQKGAKVGNTIKIRDRNQFVTRTGANLSTQDIEEAYIDLTVEDQIGVDFTFSSEELTMHIDEFAERYLKGAAATLAATMESKALEMYNEVPNFVDNIGSAMTVANVANGRKAMVDNLSPKGDWCMVHDTRGNVDLVDATKGLFNAQAEIAKQYREGAMGKHGGFMHYENTLMHSHTGGTAAATTGYLVNGASQTGSSLTIDTGSNTLVKGDVITIAGVNRVHPETKDDTGVLQQFVVTADSGASATSLSIYPAITTSGGRQNVSGSPADNAAISKVSGGASATFGQSLGFQKDAFAFATVDLVKPNGVHFCGREVMDGISMRVIQDYTISDDKFPCRFDIMYGRKAVRPKNAVRIGHN